jgi:hypothetical protein
MTMAVYTIIRVYKVPAKDRIEATNVMMEALAFGVERDFHDKDVIREPDGGPLRPVNSPSATWNTCRRCSCSPTPIR